MRVLIIYDSLYGNTKKVAEAIYGGFSSLHKVSLIGVGEATIEKLKNADLLVIGSPTHGGRPKQDLSDFLEKIPSKFLQGKKVAVFDTRLLEKDLNFALRLLVRVIGYAATKMAKTLADKGGKIIETPEGFIVRGKNGPLATGEAERAALWIKNLVKK